MDYKMEIIKSMQKMSGKYSVYGIFSDWVQMLSLAISNSIDLIHREERERQYLDIAKKYTPDEMKEICDLTGMLTSAAEQEMTDILGHVYMHMDVSSRALGQFFTPYHVAKLTACLSTIDTAEIEQVGYMTVNEPSCGAGANIIAFAEHMKEQGHNYQQEMLVTCQDLDWTAVYMCYVQLSIYGIPAIVVQGDTLQRPYCGGEGNNVFMTPLYALNAYRYGWR